MRTTRLDCSRFNNKSLFLISRPQLFHVGADVLIVQMCTEGFSICSLSCPSTLLMDPSVSCSSLVWPALLLERQKAAQVQMPGASLCLALARLNPPFQRKYFR